MSPLGGPIPQQGVEFQELTSQLPITRISALEDVEVFHARYPLAAPTEGKDRPVNWAYGDPEYGEHNGYSKYGAANVSGEYMLTHIPNGMIGLYRLADGAYLGELAVSQTNGINQVSEPRWDRSGQPGTATMIYYHISGKLYKQDVMRGFSSQIEVATLTLGGQPAIVSGDEGDWDFYGRYFAFKFGTHNEATGNYDNPCVGVYDRTLNTVLPGAIAGNPNAVDMSPTGEWLAVLPHTGSTLEQSNRFYRVSELAQGIVDRPVYVDSTAVNGFRSIGHNGWGFDRQGNEVLIYQDNRDDWMKAFNPETGKSFNIYFMADWGWDDLNFHIAAQKNPNFPGWFLYSSYSDGENPLPTGWDANQLMMIEIKPYEENPHIWRLGSSQNATRSYDSESFASIDFQCKYIYWGANWGARGNVETFRMKLPDNWLDELTVLTAVPVARTGDWVLRME